MKKFDTPTIELLLLSNADIVVTSGGPGDPELITVNGENSDSYQTELTTAPLIGGLTPPYFGKVNQQ